MNKYAGCLYVDFFLLYQQNVKNSYLFFSNNFHKNLLRLNWYYYIMPIETRQVYLRNIDRKEEYCP